MRDQTRWVAVALGLGVSSSAWAQALNFTVEFDGMINGEPLLATGSGSMDRRGQGNNFGEIDFEDLPGGFDPFAVDTLLTNICPNGFRAEGGSDNLWDLAGGSYGIERTFQWIGLPGSTISATALVEFDEELQTVHSSMHLTGNYDGPTDLLGIESYSVLWLPSSAEGEMFEAGTAVVRRANGEQLLVQFATRYFGMDHGLSAPQFGVAEFDATFDGRTLTMGWDGYFEVVPAPASLTVLLAAGLLGRRRR
ncbi:MAG: hypothetical protein IT431_04770 [Phycisphaerales bacterium]|nr:hypothetical protein [Phycisphaerales bacterium]